MPRHGKTKPHRFFVLLAVLPFLLSPIVRPAGAGTQDNAKLALHATNLVGMPCTNSAILTTPCSSYVTARPMLAPGSYVYLVVTQADPVFGIKGLSCGIDYTGSAGVGIDPQYVSWTYCGDGLDFPSDGGNGDWPAPAGGMRLTWNTCQSTEIAPDQVHAVAGFFYVYAYSPDKFEITRNENLSAGPDLQVADCAPSPSNLPLSHAGFVEFGGGTGYNPCTAPPPPAPSNFDAKLVLHASDAPTGVPLCAHPELPTRPCSGYNTSRAESTGTFVYLVVGQADPVAGIRYVSCGIDYTGSPGVGINPASVYWHGCADGSEIPNDGGNGNWPAPAGGIQVTWNTCQTNEIIPDNVHGVVGAFYVYAYGNALFKLTQNNNLASGPELKVADCAFALYDLPISHAGFVEFKTGRGYNPCADPPPVVGIEDQLPARFTLLPAVPNPSHATTNVRFDLPEPAEVTLHVFALDGSLVRELAHDTLYPAGRHELQWDGRNDLGQRAGAGVYFVRLKSGESSESVQKIVRIDR